MSAIEITVLILWGIAGILTMTNKEISKISFIITWGYLMFQLIDKYLVA